MRNFIKLALILLTTSAFSQKTETYNNVFYATDGKIVKEQITYCTVQYNPNSSTAMIITLGGGNVEVLEQMEFLNSGNGSTTARYVDKNTRKMFIITTYSDTSKGFCKRETSSRITACFSND